MLMQIVNKLNKSIKEEKVWLGHALTLGPARGRIGVVARRPGAVAY